MTTKKQSDGFSAIATILAILVIAGVGFGGWLVWRNHHPKKNNTSQSSTKPKDKVTAADPYAGWQTAASSRSGFSIKYPHTWTYKEVLGSKDNVEHITIDSSQFHLTIDSYAGKDAASGGQPATACTDCLHTTNSTNFTAPKIGKIDVKTVTYKLDSGQGNALILELPDSTYYIPSPDHANVYTSFRGISVLGSENAYQAETPGQFTANPDFAVAKKILASVSY